jgi:metallo-beta-lactamase class B
MRALVIALLLIGTGSASAQDPTAVEPFLIADNLYYVGDSDVAVYLVVGSEGHVLLDTGYDRMVPQVVSSIEALGFDPADIELILNSHAHLDHAGGHAAMKARTGGLVLANAGDVRVLEAGGLGDPVLGDRAPFPPVSVDRVLEDGERVRLGDIEMAANRTGGHTEGCTSWSMEVDVDGVARTAVFICSLSILGPARLTGPDASYPGVADDYRASYATLRGLGCDVFLASHAGFFDLEAKRAALRAGLDSNPFHDPDGCAGFIDRAERTFLERLEAEVGG